MGTYTNGEDPDEMLHNAGYILTAFHWHYFKYISFLNSHFGYLANSVDPDQPASEEAG